MCFEPAHAPFASGGLGLRSGRIGLTSLIRTEPNTVFNSDEVTISPAPGTLLLWPSQLVHGYSGNALDGRLSLSFNLLPTQLLGSSYGLAIAPLANKVSS